MVNIVTTPGAYSECMIPDHQRGLMYTPERVSELLLHLSFLNYSAFLVSGSCGTEDHRNVGWEGPWKRSCPSFPLEDYHHHYISDELWFCLIEL